MTNLEKIKKQRIAEEIEYSKKRVAEIRSYTASFIAMCWGYHIKCERCLLKSNCEFSASEYQNPQKFWERHEGCTKIIEKWLESEAEEDDEL